MLDTSDLNASVSNELETAQQTGSSLDPKPNNYTLVQQLKWSHAKTRKIEVQKYVQEHPNEKAKDVLKWIREQAPDAWPEGTVRKLNNLIRRLPALLNLQTKKTQGRQFQKYR